MLQVKEAFERHLKRLVERQSFPHPQLLKGVQYTLLDGGKRLRPLLAIHIALALGATIDEILQPACSLEMIHTYSLIHDDLPCMDNDDFRRGKPSLHKVIGEANALLVGDFLLTYAFDSLSRAQLDSETRIHLISALSEAAGANGMVGGQMMDLAQFGSRDERSLKKTGALFKASFLFGAIIAKAPFKPFESLGERVGLFYQKCDDLIDGDLPLSEKEKVYSFREMIESDCKNILGSEILSPIFDLMISKVAH